MFIAAFTAFICLVVLGNQCPHCLRFWVVETIKAETVQKGGFFQDEKKRYTFKCKHCGHEWQETRTMDYRHYE
jgi:hypothetical protein